jgi:hypothetical protein
MRVQLVRSGGCRSKVLHRVTVIESMIVGGARAGRCVRPRPAAMCMQGLGSVLSLHEIGMILEHQYACNLSISWYELVYLSIRGRRT